MMLFQGNLINQMRCAFSTGFCFVDGCFDTRFPTEPSTRRVAVVHCLDATQRAFIFSPRGVGHPLLRTLKALNNRPELCNTFGVNGAFVCGPRVVHSREQPWAYGCNAFGVNNLAA